MKILFLLALMVAVVSCDFEANRAELENKAKDFATSVEKFKTSFGETIEKYKPKLQADTQKLDEEIKKDAAKIKATWDKDLESFKEDVAKVTNKNTKFATKDISKIMESAQKLAQSISPNVQKMFTSMGKSLNDFVEKYQKIFERSGIAENVAEVMGAAQQLMQDLTATAEAKIEQLKTEHAGPILLYNLVQKRRQLKNKE